MKKFLEYVAKDILSKYGSDLSRIAVVFPNKRASIFLNEQLALKSSTPVWSPSYITISDFFRRHSNLLVGDSIKLICDIHKSFIECTNIDESLDHFWGWGQILLSDFDDIDKNMADAADVFKNVTNLHELDDISYLTDEQKEVLHRFFSNFREDNQTELKKRFLKLWCHLYDIYANFKQRLREQGIAYEGMLYRDVAENKENTYDEYDMYLFVGFNVVQKVEQKVFTRLWQNGKAKFYWDFDYFYMPKPNSIMNEAGHYVSQYISMFPNELDDNDATIYDQFRTNKEITYIRTPTDNVQARFVNAWLKEYGRYKHGKDTAIVMCDESMLPSVIHYLPEEVESVNITTGFPLFQTTISTFVLQMLELRTYGYSASSETFRSRFVIQLLGQPYAKYLSSKTSELSESLKVRRIYDPKKPPIDIDDGMNMLLRKTDNNEDIMLWIIETVKAIATNADDKSPLFQESVFRMYTLCNRICELIKSKDLEVDLITLQKLITQIISTTSIPFHGEPAEGVQVMGILETRNLDFDHILMLSCNEGNMPKGVNDSSFIPYSIRKAHGLTTIDNKVSIYAYYFYNLLQRASDITIVYNSSTGNGHTGEMSRFMLQLLVESGFHINQQSIKMGYTIDTEPISCIEKDVSVMNVLDSFEKISPTAINRYMRCPLQFYFNNIIGIKEPDNIEDEMDNRIFGNIFHTASEFLYKELASKRNMIFEEQICYAMKHKELIERIVDKAFDKEVFNSSLPGSRHDLYNGLQLISREVIIKYVTRLLELDRELAPLRIIGTEIDAYTTIEFSTSKGKRKIEIGGRIDRIDQINDKSTNKERIRVVDYKTGSRVQGKVDNVEEIFNIPPKPEMHADYYLQTMLYSCIIADDKALNPSNLSVSPALLFIQRASEEGYDPTIVIGKEKVYDIYRYKEVFERFVSNMLSAIFDPTLPFKPTEDIRTCTNCPYRNICNK